VALFVIYALVWGTQHTANERVEAALPARNDGWEIRDIDNDRVHEGGVGRDDEDGRLVAGRYLPLDPQVHAPDLVGPAPQPADRAPQPPAHPQNQFFKLLRFLGHLSSRSQCTPFFWVKSTQNHAVWRQVIWSVQNLLLH
jgi:hypothetical protein